MHLLPSIAEYIKNNSLIAPGDRIIVGLSGGPDSVYLLYQLLALKKIYNLELIAAHLDHGWRTESAADAAWCATLTKQVEVPFVSAHAREFPDIIQDGSQEAHGRTLRRAFFARLHKEYAAQSVALAQHQDDQIETFFIRLMRGAGLEGLASMHARSGIFIRPLLCIDKATILRELAAADISYLVDPTNTSTEYLRNCIRTQAVPALQSCDERFAPNMLRTIEHLQQAEDYIETVVSTTWHDLAHNKSIDIKKLFELHPFMRTRMIIHWLVEAQVPFTPSAALFAEIERFLQSPQGGEHVFYHTWKIVKKQGHAYIVK